MSGFGRPPDRSKLVAIYLRHHVAAASGGVDFFKRVARTVSDRGARAELGLLAAEVAEDQTTLLEVLDVLGVDRHRAQERLVSWGEKLGRLKPNGTLLRRSPLTDVVELEALGVALRAKLLGWLTLRELSHHDPRLKSYQFDQLAKRALEQQERIETLRLHAIRRGLVDRANDPRSGKEPS